MQIYSTSPVVRKMQIKIYCYSISHLYDGNPSLRTCSVVKLLGNELSLLVGEQISATPLEGDLPIFSKKLLNTAIAFLRLNHQNIQITEKHIFSKAVHCTTFLDCWLA